MGVLLYMQNKSEGTLFERMKIDWKFGKLISAIIEKSWPKDDQGRYEEDEEVVLQHLLSWTAAKNVFQLHGTLYLQCAQAMVTFFFWQGHVPSFLQLHSAEFLFYLSF